MASSGMHQYLIHRSKFAQAWQGPPGLGHPFVAGGDAISTERTYTWSTEAYGFATEACGFARAVVRVISLLSADIFPIQ